MLHLMVKFSFRKLFMCLSIFQAWVFAQECSQIGSGDGVYTLSSEPLTSVKAMEKCHLSGGELANLRNSSSNILRKVLETYSKGFQRVWAFQNGNAAAQNFKYATSPNATTGWNHVLYKNKPFSFYLAQESSKKANVKILFCRDKAMTKWLVSGSKCSNAWTLDFELYGMSSLTDESALIYRQTHQKTFSTSLFPQILNSSSFKYAKKFYTPVINVRFGAIVLSPITSSNPSACSPTVYSYKWGDWMENCRMEINATTEYVCKSKLLASATQRCSDVQVNWRNNLKFLPNSGKGKDISITVSVRNRSSEIFHKRTPYLSGFMYLDKIKSNDQLQIKVSADFASCKNQTISTSLVYKPRNLQNYLLHTQSFKLRKRQCFLSLTDSQINFCSFQVIISSNNITETKTIAFNYEKRYSFKVEQHDLNQPVNFTVFATSLYRYQGVLANISCSGPSKVSRQQSMIGLIIGVVVTILLLVVVIMLVVFYYTRRRNKNFLPTVSIYRPREHPLSFNSPFRTGSNNHTTINVIEIPPSQPSARIHNDLYENTALTENIATTNPETKNLSSAIDSSKLMRYYLEHSQNCNEKFRKLYEKVCEECGENKESNQIAKMARNKAKNRYQDIYPYDSARVILLTNKENDYINAAYIQGYRESNRFIATQGPKKETVDDFWRMIWERETTMIIMLSNLYEFGRNKCAKYWPDLGLRTEHGELKLESIEDEKLIGLTRRRFILSGQNSKRFVTQFQMTSWPDHGVPVTSSNLLYLIDKVKKLEGEAPVVVHCSAGVGRTGTFIAIDVLFDQINEEGRIDVVSLMKKMRQCRTNMIQSLDQFVYIHRLLAEYNWSPESDRSIEEFRILSTDQRSGIIQDEFDRLDALKPLHGSHELGNKEESEEADKRVSIIFPGSTDEVFIDANYASDLSFTRTYVTTSSGQLDDVTFWLMIIECNISNCLDLDNKDSAVSCMNVGEVKKYGEVEIKIMDVEKREGCIYQKIRVSIDYELFESVEVHRYSGFSWSNDVDVPSHALVKAIRSILSQETKNKKSKLLVQCNTGEGRSGTVITAMNAIDRINSLQRIDVFRTTLDLRNINSELIDNMDNYIACYLLICEYLALECENYEDTGWRI